MAAHKHRYAYWDAARRYGRCKCGVFKSPSSRGLIGDQAHIEARPAFLWGEATPAKAPGKRGHRVELTAWQTE